MDGLLLGGLGFAATLVLILLEVPVGVAMGLVGILGVIFILGPEATVAMSATSAWESITNYTLTMLPLFVLMGNLAVQTGLSTRLFRSMTVLIGHRRGGLALATIGASAGFGMIAGSSLATTATMGRIALPEMERAGYPRKMAAGTVAAGGTLGILIPPSTILVIYAFLAEQSIRQLMLATAGPVALAVLLYGLAVWLPLVLGRAGFSGISRDKATSAEKRAAVLDMSPAIFVFGLVMGGLYTGIFTANETAAVGAAVMLAYGVLSRRLSLKDFVAAALDTATTCGALYLVLIAANLFNGFLALTGLPFLLTGLFSGIMDSPFLVILMMTAVYFVAGMLMDELAMLLLTIPLFVPICQMAGVDLVWFGIYAVVIVELGLITPPGGMNLFVLKTTNPEYTMLELWKGVIPFIIADLVRLALACQDKVQGAAAEVLLDSYESERKPNAREYIQTAVRLGGLINTAGTEAALRAALPAADGSARMESIAPPLGPGLGLGDRAGRLFGQPRMAGGALMDETLRHRWVLVADPAVLAGVDLPAGLTIVTPDAAPDAARHLARLNTRAVVLRPDRHTLGAADTPAELAALLALVLPAPTETHEPEMA